MQGPECHGNVTLSADVTCVFRAAERDPRSPVTASTMALVAFALLLCTTAWFSNAVLLLCRVATGRVSLSPEGH